MQQDLFSEDDFNEVHFEEVPQNHFSEKLGGEIEAAGGEWQDEFPDAAGRTAFDSPNSKDNTVTVLVPPQNISKVPSRSLVRIESRPQEKGGDGRRYLCVVVQGPFAEPDGLKSDAPTLVAMSVRGTMFMPRYHGRAQLAILGEILDDDTEDAKYTLIPPRFRPLPNSPIYPLSNEETQVALNIIGDIQLGLAVGYEKMPVCISAKRKDVFPRHMAILGTTGGGKSTTLSGLIGQLAADNVAVIVLDTEGEYTHIMHPTEDERMLKALKKLGQSPAGVPNVELLSLEGKDSRNESHSSHEKFGLQFSELSPYSIIEILGLNTAQEERFLRAYDIARVLLSQLNIFPVGKEEQEEALELDEQETGIPKLTLDMFYDIVRAYQEAVGKVTTPSDFVSSVFLSKSQDVRTRLTPLFNLNAENAASWRKVQGSLNVLRRLQVFDKQKLPDFKKMTEAGRVTIVDMSGSESRQINNLVISQILRGIWKQQEENYETAGEEPQRVVIIIEEAHEFLAASRIKQMQNVLDQVTRIARRGRKRWLGLIFVSQSPEDFPDELLGLVNNFILHKITNASVINRLSRSIGGIDQGLWDRVSNLEAGVAIVKAGGLTQPMLVAIDPTPHKLLMVD